MCTHAWISHTRSMCTQEKDEAEIDAALEEVCDSYRKELGLTYGQVDALRLLHGPARIRKMAGMLRVRLVKRML